VSRVLTSPCHRRVGVGGSHSWTCATTTGWRARWAGSRNLSLVTWAGADKAGDSTLVSQGPGRGGAWVGKCHPGRSMLWVWMVDKGGIGDWTRPPSARYDMRLQPGDARSRTELYHRQAGASACITARIRLRGRGQTAASDLAHRVDVGAEHDSYLAGRQQDQRGQQRRGYILHGRPPGGRGSAPRPG
jgi:hypothetical protein